MPTALELIGQAQAAAAAREHRTRTLLDFVRATKSDYEANWHHVAIASALDQVLAGTLTRLLITVPPRHGKSQLVSRHFPAYVFGQQPDWEVIACSYGATLASAMNRAVQAIMDHPDYHALFPGTRLAGPHVRTGSRPLRNSEEFEIVGRKGRYCCAGVGGGITGKGGMLLLIDDPVKDRQAADSPTIRDSTYQWYTTVLRTRLAPQGRIVLCQCMTGDTPVTMADGTYRRLDGITVGDQVLAYEQGRTVVRPVLNWSAQGEDDLIEIRTGSSRVRCNARHPFLTSAGWKCASDLRVGDRIATNTRIPGRARRLSATEAWLLGFMFGDGWVTRRDTTQKGRGRSVAKEGTRRGSAETVSPRRGYVTGVALSLDAALNERVLRAFHAVFGCRPTRSEDGYARTDRAVIGRWFLNHGLVGRAKTTRLPAWLYRECPRTRRAFLKGFHAADGSLRAHGPMKGRWAHGRWNEELMRDIRHLARGVGCPVTNRVMTRARRHAPHRPAPILATAVPGSWRPTRGGEAFQFQRVRSIRPAGRGLVYDLQVAGAECFIADGLVSHNTRWHEDDLAGRLLRDAAADPHADQWTVLNFEAIKP